MNACSGGSSDTATTSTTSYNIQGYVQKGPFINGTSITIYELDNSLVPLGKSFNSQIKDNTGNFTLKNVAFSFKYVQLKADG